MVDLWGTATGLLEGLRARLSDADALLFEQAIAHLEVIWSGKEIAEPGSEIWQSLCKEQFDESGFRANYQTHLAKLISDLKTSATGSVTCCDYHRRLFRLCSDHVGDPGASWFTSFLEILSATSLDLHFQYLSSIDLAVPIATDLHLSRFMRIETFVRNHTTAPPTDSALKDFRENLSPEFTRSARQACWRTNELGMWHGRLGSYPAFAGAAEKYSVWCENIKPFATLTNDIDVSHDRKGPPCRVLQLLGIPFASGQYWVELIYAAKFAAFHRKDDLSLRLAIPTQLESAGNWAFVPDRDPDNSTNHARDLKTGFRGMKEIIHERVAVAALDDVIVWGAPTNADWTQPSSPFAVA
jgi:hypothetical protein